MSRLRDRLAPLLAGILVLLVGASVVLLLRGASNQGIKALTQAKLAQVQATANSFNARVSAQLGAVAGLGNSPWELVPGSKADQAVLHTFDVDPKAQSGFYLLDAHDKVTSGVLLRPGALGSTFTAPTWDKAKAQLASAPAIVLPVTTKGLTTELPSYAFVVAIRGKTPGSVRGALVLEQALTSTSPFQQEIAQLGKHNPSSAAWFFLDSTGSVVATTRASGLGQPTDDPRLLTAHFGESTLGKQIAFIESVPTLGWRVVFREDSSQFKGPLSGPLQRAGLILVLLLLAVGLTVVVILVRRLSQAREQERRLTELTRSQAEFISVVSHELRTPVAGVLGFLQTTVDHWDALSDPDRRSAVERAVTNARRLQAMTRDVLDTESIESGRLGYAFRRVDLAAELRTAVSGVSTEHVLDLQLPDSPLPVDADPDRLQQVIGNLVENALKNSPPEKPVVVRAELYDKLVRVSVVDEGPGVAAEARERIFEKFVRGDPNAVSGTGLGLYIVRRIVEAHQGRIWCDSVPGSPTAFVFELPLAH
ncbi:MAG: sensor histidine kinase [Frankiales bacterium]|nr:sensor histidine kinase [Frankiales bacterium]